MFSLYFFYFTLGMVFQFPQVALRMHLIDNLAVSPAALTGMYGLMSIPWFAKPLYAFFSDSFPVYGWHKRPYVVGASVLCSATWFWMQAHHSSVWEVVGLLTLSSFFLCVGDVITDGVMVQQAQLEEDVGRLQARCRAARASGTLVASILGPFTKTQLGLRDTCLITALLPLANACVSLCLPEVRGGASRRPCATMRRLREAFQAPETRKLGLFVFATSLLPSYYMALTFYLQENRNFSVMLFGELDMVSSACTVVGALAFSRFFRACPVRRIILFCVGVSFFLRMFQLLLVFHINGRLGIPDAWFVGLELVAFSTVGAVANMPIAILCARLAPSGLEATFYATLMSLANVGGGLGSAWSALLTDAFGVSRENFSNLWQLILTCNVLGLFTLVAVRLLPAPEALPFEVLPEGEKKVQV
jgi:hypothetical protein